MKWLWIGIYTLFPFFALSLMFTLVFLAIAYIAPIVGLIYYVYRTAKKRELFNQWILPIGFLPTPLVAFLISDYDQDKLFALIIMYYATPFAIIFTITAISISVVKALAEN